MRRVANLHVDAVSPQRDRFVPAPKGSSGRHRLPPSNWARPDDHAHLVRGENGGHSRRFVDVLRALWPRAPCERAGAGLAQHHRSSRCERSIVKPRVCRGGLPRQPRKQSNMPWGDWRKVKRIAARFFLDVVERVRIRAGKRGERVTKEGFLRSPVVMSPVQERVGAVRFGRPTSRSGTLGQARASTSVGS